MENELLENYEVTILEAGGDFKSFSQNHRKLRVRFRSPAGKSYKSIWFVTPFLSCDHLMYTIIDKTINMLIIVNII